LPHKIIDILMALRLGGILKNPLAIGRKMSHILLLIPLLSGLGQAMPPQVIELPFTLVHGAIIVQATVNGQGPFDMMLDTGADPSLVDLATAKAIGLKLSSTGQAGSGTGADVNLAYESSPLQVQLGQLMAKDVAALALNLSDLSTHLDRKIGGVLGYSLLNNRIVQIDYPQRKVRFYAEAPPPCAAKSATCITLPFRYQDDIVISGVTVNGRAATANLDTGSNGTFLFTPGAVAKLGLDAAVAQATKGASTGFNGTAENRKGTVDRVTLGPLVVDKPAATFYGKNTGYEKEPWDVRIGSAFLKDYVVIVDYPHGLITLRKL
jgi:predicted aspartyl protease